MDVELTTAEMRVLAAATQGLDVAGIAKFIDRRPNTVKTHLGKLMMKLGVNNRTHLVVRALRLGIVELNDDCAVSKSQQLLNRWRIEILIKTTGRWVPVADGEIYENRNDAIDHLHVLRGKMDGGKFRLRRQLIINSVDDER